MKEFVLRAVCALGVISFAGAAQAARYKEINVNNGGTISGKVAAGKAAAKTKSFTISKDPQICGTGTRDVSLVEINNGVVKNAVVYLYKVKQGKPFPKELKAVTLNQKECTFAPLFAVMANGGKITAVNQDPTLHNIHTYEIIGKARRTVFNVSQPKAGDKFTKKVKMRRGVGMKIECDAHDFMHGYMFIAPSPYYAVINDKGEFKIDNIPPGEYKVRLWHGFLGEKKAGKIKVTAGGNTRINLSF